MLFSFGMQPAKKGFEVIAGLCSDAWAGSEGIYCGLGNKIAAQALRQPSNTWTPQLKYAN